MLSEKGQSEKSKYCEIPNLWHSEKEKTMKTIKPQWLPGTGAERDAQAEQREFLGQWNYSVWYIMMGLCHCIFVQTYRIYNTKCVPQDKLWT